MSGSRLSSRLVETILLIGGDEQSGLHLQRNRNQSEVDNSGLKKYQPNILGIINESTAVYPFHLLPVDPLYPPEPFKTNRSNSEMKYMTQQSSTDESSEQELPKFVKAKRNTGHWKCRKSFSVSAYKTIERRQPLQQRCTIEKGTLFVDDTTVKNETIEGIPCLCFPDGISTSPYPSDEKFQYLVLTNIKGERLYAISMVVYRKYQCIEEDDGSVTLRRRDDDEPYLYLSHAANSTNFQYIPTAVVVLSQSPYFSVVCQSLSSLHSQIKKNDHHIKDLVEYFAACLTNTPSPPIGDLGIEFVIFDHPVMIPPPISPLNKVIDFDITILFQYLSVTDIVYIIIAIIQQRRIVAVSSKQLVTTLCCESLLYLIQPFQWRFTYIPFLPESLLEILDAPGPYILGFDVEHISAIEENAEDVIIVNLDTGVVKTCEEVSVCLPPTNFLHQLVSSLEHREMSYEHFMLGKLFPLSFKESKISRKLFDVANQSLISDAFYCFFMDVFETIPSFIHQNGDSPGSSIYFQSENFLRFHADCKEFYIEVFKTDMFEAFLDATFLSNVELSNVNGEGVSLRITLEREKSKQSFSGTRKKSSSALPIRSVLSFNEKLEQCQQNFVLFALPEFGNMEDENVPKNFFSRCLEKLMDQSVNDVLEENYNFCCIMIKCNINLALKKYVEVLKDYYNLIQLNAKCLTKADIISVINNMSTAELQEHSKETFLRSLKEFVEFDESSSEMVTPERIEKKFQIPNKSLDKNELSDLLQRASITWNSELQKTLFTCLTFDQQIPPDFISVDPEVFKLFYVYWVQQADDIDIDLYSNSVFKNNEIILKVSNQPIRIDPFGNGYLIVTHMRLLFIPLGGRKVQNLISFSEITNITEDVSMFKLFSYGTKTLTISHCLPNHQNIVLWFKTSTNAWFVLLREIWSSHIIATEEKDESLVNLAIDNFLVLDTLFVCAEIETYFEKHMEKCVRLIAKFTALQKENVKLSEDTKCALVRRVVPMAQDTPKRSVEYLLWFKNISTNSRYENFWASYFSNPLGKIVSIDTENFTVRKTILTKNTRFMCMLWLKSKVVWVGAKDHKIYILDSVNGNLVDELPGNKDMVLSLSKSKDESLVVSVNLIGEIIIWESLSRKIKIQLKVDGCTAISISGNRLFCNISSAVLIYSMTTYESIARLPFTQSSSSPRLHARYGIECMCNTKDYAYLGLGRQARLVIYDIRRIVSPQFVTEIDLDSDINPCRKARLTCSKCKSKGKKRSKCTTCKPEERCRGLIKLVMVSPDHIWACCKDGNIFIFRPSTLHVAHTLQGHSDAIQSVCTNNSEAIDNLLVLTGGRSEDGKVAVWNVSSML